MKHTFRCYRTADQLVSALECIFGPADERLLSLVKRHGKWAFVQIPLKRIGGKIDRKRKATVHWWASPRCSMADVAMMLGHELGHITGTPARGNADEEDRADRYGEVAREVLMQLRRTVRR